MHCRAEASTVGAMAQLRVGHDLDFLVDSNSVREFDTGAFRVNMTVIVWQQQCCQVPLVFITLHCPMENSNLLLPQHQLVQVLLYRTASG